MTEKIKLPRIIAFYEQMDLNVYAKAAYTRMCKDVDSVLGIVDGRLKTLAKSDNIDNRYFVCYVESIMINLLFRVGLFEKDKEFFLKRMEYFYELYHMNDAEESDSSTLP